MGFLDRFKTHTTTGHVASSEKLWDERKTSSEVDNAFDGRIIPVPSFKDRQEFYTTVGRFQNTVDGLVLDVINREWSYDNENGNAPEEAIKAMEEWEEQWDVTSMFENIIRGWCIHGCYIISPADWQGVQMSSVVGMKRDDFGNPEFFIQQVKGQEQKLEAEKFIFTKYIDLDRSAWPIAMFESIMTEWEDIDGFIGLPLLKVYRQALKDFGKILHKYGNPLAIYGFKGVNKETIDNDIVPLFEGARAGDRIVLNANLTDDMQQLKEEIDGNARFMEYLVQIVKEIDTGLQTSKNRLITDPSAMADAREARLVDDDRTMGIMEKLRKFMNNEVIPRVTGLEAGEIEFKWGAKDAFDMQFPEALEKAVEKNIIEPWQAAKILEKQFRWKIPKEDDLEPEERKALEDKRDMEQQVMIPDEKPQPNPQKQADNLKKQQKEHDDHQKHNEVIAELKEKNKFSKQVLNEIKSLEEV